MTVVEKCAKCGEPLTDETVEAYENRCIDCAITEAASRGGPRVSRERNESARGHPKNQRGHLRVPAALPATLIDIMGSQSVVITEISASGAQVRGSRPPVAGSPLSLILTGAGTIRARLVRWDENTGGLAFLENPSEIASRLVLTSPHFGLSLR